MDERQQQACGISKAHGDSGDVSDPIGGPGAKELNEPPIAGESRRMVPDEEAKENQRDGNRMDGPLRDGTSRLA